MKKLIVCLLTLTFSQPIHAHNLADIIEEALPSITYIEVERHVTRKVIDTSQKVITNVKDKSTPSAGTGFVIEGNKIVTNFHVISRGVRDKEKIYVTFFNNNGIRYEARVLGYDEVADVAILEIDGQHPSLKIATLPENIRMGEDIFTISNFYSIRHSVTQGIVSSNNRGDRRYPYVRLLQLQILQGSGSSGGPVLDDDGKVVGLNHTILSMVPDDMYKTASPMLMSMTAFTIRGDQLARSIERIKKEGVVRRADLGLYLRSYGMNSERYLYDPVPNSRDVSGVLVMAVDKNGPTDFKKDDIIIDVDGKHFTSAAELLLWLDENKEIGDEVKIQLYRDGSLLNITTQVRVANRFR
jgi:serine protease Do